MKTLAILAGPRKNQTTDKLVDVALAGANIVMPNITDKKYRKYYRLYEGKPCLEQDSEECLSCMQARIQLMTQIVAYNKWGDSRHFFKRIKHNSKTGGN